MSKDTGEILEDTPSTRSDWGADELDALNYPTGENVLDVGVPPKIVHSSESPVDPVAIT